MFLKCVPKLQQATTKARTIFSLCARCNIIFSAKTKSFCAVNFDELMSSLVQR